MTGLRRIVGALSGLASFIRLRLMPRTLFARTLVIFITPLVLVQVVSAYFFYDRYWNVIAERLADGVATEIAMTVTMFERARDGRAVVPPMGDEDTAPPFATPQRTDPRSVLLMAERQFGHALAFVPDGELPEAEPPRGPLHRVMSEAVAERLGRDLRVDAIGMEERVEVLVALDGGLLRALVPIDRVFDSSMYAFALWMMGSATLLLLIALLFMRNQIRPIRRLAVAAERFGRGREVGHFPLRGALEVRQAAQAFLVMRDRLRRQLQQREEMLAGVSHDLRTPLTRMRLQAAMIDDSQVRADLTADLDEMHQMIEGYLAFARGEGGEAPESCDVAAFLRDVVGKAQGAHGPDRISLAIEPSLAGVTASLRRQALARCLDNLIANGVRYGGTVQVTGRAFLDRTIEQTQIEILIDDDGPGIPASDREAVFRPFHRRESSRNQATGGVGLGLTIARDVARSHGGDLTLHESPAGGLRCYLRVPA